MITMGCEEKKMLSRTMKARRFPLKFCCYRKGLCAKYFGLHILRLNVYSPIFILEK